MSITLQVTDPSLEGTQWSGVDCVAFCRDEANLPSLASAGCQGFIIRMHRVKMQFWMPNKDEPWVRKPQLLMQIRPTGKASAFALFPAEPLPVASPHALEATHWSHHKYSAPDPLQLDGLRRWVAARAAAHAAQLGANHPAPPPRPVAAPPPPAVAAPPPPAMAAPLPPVAAAAAPLQPTVPGPSENPGKLHKLQDLPALLMRPAPRSGPGAAAGGADVAGVWRAASMVDMICQVVAIDYQLHPSYWVLHVWDGTDMPPISPLVSMPPLLPEQPGADAAAAAAAAAVVATDRVWAMPLRTFASLQAEDRSWAVLSAAMRGLPVAGSTLPVLMPVRLMQQALASHVASPQEGEPAHGTPPRQQQQRGRQALQPAAQPRPGAVHVGQWYKMKGLAPFVVEGQVQALVLAKSRFRLRREGQCAAMLEAYQQRIAGRGGMALHAWAPRDPARWIARAAPQLRHLPLRTLREVLMMADRCDHAPVRVLARVTAISPKANSTEMVKKALEISLSEDMDEWGRTHGMGERFAPGHVPTYCLRLELQDATGALQVVLLGPDGGRFFWCLPVVDFVDAPYDEATACMMSLQGVVDQLTTHPPNGQPPWIEAIVRPMYRYKDNPWTSAVYCLAHTHLQLQPGAEPPLSPRASEAAQVVSALAAAASAAAAAAAAEPMDVEHVAGECGPAAAGAAVAAGAAIKEEEGMV